VNGGKFLVKIQSYKELEVWRIAMDLTEAVYNITARFPADERYGLAQQMHRCAVSVPSNIAEGSSRSGTKELVQFIYISLGSLAELETQLLIAQRRNYIEDKQVLEEALGLISSVGKMLTRLVQSLQSKAANKSLSTVHHTPFTTIKEAL
jgi:four helix bundle protein